MRGAAAKLAQLTGSARASLSAIPDVGKSLHQQDSFRGTEIAMRFRAWRFR